MERSKTFSDNETPREVLNDVLKPRERPQENKTLSLSLKG